MIDKKFRLSNHRRLPGQSDLEDTQWAEVEARLNDTYWRETQTRAREARAKRINLSENLKALRLRLDLKQAEFAAQLEISLRSLQMYERGERPIPSDLLGSLYSIYDIDIHKLFTSSPREPSDEWRRSYSASVLTVAAHIRDAWPELDEDDVAALTCEYTTTMEPGQTIDKAGIMMCYDRLFQPMDYDGDDYEG